VAVTNNSTPSYIHAGRDLTELLRAIRNVAEHWSAPPRGPLANLRCTRMRCRLCCQFTARPVCGGMGRIIGRA